MARRRFFVDRVSNGQAEIEGENAHHLTRVLRVEVGQKYELTDTERVWLGEVETARKNLVRFTLIEEMERGLQLPDTVLYLALIKFERFEWAVEKATELGVTRIVPVEAARSERGLFDGAKKRAERWRKIAREASEQSRRLRAPEIAEPMKLRDVFMECAATPIWLDERLGAAALLDALVGAQTGGVRLVIGPEGGWADSEREQFAASGCLGASLGTLVLRAETAVCAALAVVAQVRITSPPIQSRQPDAS